VGFEHSTLRYLRPPGYGFLPASLIRHPVNYDIFEPEKVSSEPEKNPAEAADLLHIPFKTKSLTAAS
jgi:hypothetical protein